MAKPINVKCDECKKQFQLTGFESRSIEPDIEHVYFTCPHCDTEVTCYYTDTHIRQRQKRMHRMVNGEARDVALKRIKKDMAALRERMEGQGGLNC